MTEEDKIKRRLYTHNHLLGVASTLCKQAESEHEFDNLMACALFCALALAAALNFIGGSSIPVWDQHLERKLSPEGKLAVIAERARFEVKFGERPFQAFRALFEMRNQMAHGKLQDLSYESAKHWILYGGERWPAAQWETLCSAVNARSLLKDTKEIIDVIHEISGVNKIPDFLLSEHVASA